MTRFLGVVLGAVLLAGSACSDAFPVVRPASRLTIELVDTANVSGTKLEPRRLAIDTPETFEIVVRAQDPSGNVDTTYNGYVRISAKPGAIERIDSPDADGRNLKLTNGESPTAKVRLVNGYGTTYILADDLGYQPTDPTADPPPACANGLDDDGDGTIDFPADDGCAFANDNSEGGGSFYQGASLPIFYQLPRIADVRGLKCVDGSCSGNGFTPYPKEQILLDTGYHEKADGSFVHDFDMVVIRIASDGFYVADTQDTRGGFNSIFSFNFNAPPRMRVCDRLRTFAGTATEFFGLTQVSYPTWTLEEWDPQRRPCLVPEPRVLTPADIPSDTNPNGNLLPFSGSFVRVFSSPEKLEVKVTPKFGPGNMPEQNGTFIPAETATNCDLNKDGRIDFTAGGPEQRCSNACSTDPECTEWSNFEGRSIFRLTVKDLTTNTATAIQADSTTSVEFKPLERRGQVLKSFSGTLAFFSGGSQFTIEARCKDDIVVDVNAQPLPSDKACVVARTILEENPQ